MNSDTYDAILQVWNGNTEHDDFGISCELFYSMFGEEGGLPNRD